MIKVLESENLALAALLGNLKEQLSQVTPSFTLHAQVLLFMPKFYSTLPQVSLRFWFVLGLGTMVAVVLYR